MPADHIVSVPAVAPDRRVYYGPAPEQFADVYLAADAAHAPLVINIHGGFWRAAYDLTHASRFCAALAACAMNTANVEYRRVGSAGGSWPTAFEDVRAAYRFLLDHSGNLGFSPTSVVIVGHSAGGQLALCLAANESSVRNCASLAGVLDLRRAWQLHLSHDAVVEYLGGTPDQVPEHYRQASPLEIEIPGARQVILHGLQDDVVPPEISRQYAETKKHRGEQVEFVPIAGAGHFDVIDPTSKAFQIEVDHLLHLLRD